MGRCACCALTTAIASSWRTDAPCIVLCGLFLTPWEQAGAGAQEQDLEGVGGRWRALEEAQARVSGLLHRTDGSTGAAWGRLGGRSGPLPPLPAPPGAATPKCWAAGLLVPPCPRVADCCCCPTRRSMPQITVQELGALEASLQGGRRRHRPPPGAAACLAPTAAAGCSRALPPRAAAAAELTEELGAQQTRAQAVALALQQPTHPAVCRGVRGRIPLQLFLLRATGAASAVARGSAYQRGELSLFAIDAAGGEARAVVPVPRAQAALMAVPEAWQRDIADAVQTAADNWAHCQQLGLVGFTVCSWTAPQQRPAADVHFPVRVVAVRRALLSCYAQLRPSWGQDPIKLWRHLYKRCTPQDG